MWFGSVRNGQCDTLDCFISNHMCLPNGIGLLFSKSWAIIVSSCKAHNENKKKAIQKWTRSLSGLLPCITIFQLRVSFYKKKLCPRKIVIWLNVYV